MNPFNLNIRTWIVFAITWSIAWIVATIFLGLIFNYFSPHSIDSGEGPIAVRLFGFMGLLSGSMFWLLLKMGKRKSLFDYSISQLILRVFLSCALVQILFLNHGDQGIVENIKQGLLLAFAGGFISTIWTLQFHKLADSYLIKKLFC